MDDSANLYLIGPVVSEKNDVTGARELSVSRFDAAAIRPELRRFGLQSRGIIEWLDVGSPLLFSTFLLGKYNDRYAIDKCGWRNPILLTVSIHCITHTM